MKDKFILIKYNLKERARNADIGTFNKYVNGELSLQDCKYLWSKHNKVDYEEFLLISDELFKEWLASIGYKYEE